MSNYCQLIHGTSPDALRALSDSTIDAIVTDPPYGLSFMGKAWDYDVPGVETWRECLRVLKPGGHLLSFFGSRTYHRGVVPIEDAGFQIRDQIMWVYGSGFPKSKMQLKPAHEPVVLARRGGGGYLDIKGCRIGDEIRFNPPAGNKGGGNALNLSVSGMPQDVEGRSTVGRWPANFIHDGSAEVTTMLGDAARFFYCAKAGKADRGEGNTHPTVKPVELMRYLCRLITPPGGIILDPFMGSGSTGVAAIAEGFGFIGVEQELDYVEIAKGRISNIPSLHAQTQG